MTVLVMAVGNVLMGDDALGPYLLELLEAKYDFPAGVTLWDAGTPGLDLTLFLDGYDALIAIDALQAKGAPGQVQSYTRADLLRGGLPLVMSPHEPTLREALMRLEMLGRCPREVLLVGAIPQRLETGTGLSACVRDALPRIELRILHELARLGLPASPRQDPADPGIWWEIRPAAG